MTARARSGASDVTRGLMLEDYLKANLAAGTSGQTCT